MEKCGSSIVDLVDASRAAVSSFVEIVRQICRVELAFDFAVAAKQAAMRDVVPFRDQMRGDEHCLAALRLRSAAFPAVVCASPDRDSGPARRAAARARPAKATTRGRAADVCRRKARRCELVRSRARPARSKHRFVTRSGDTAQPRVKAQNFTHKSCADENWVVAANTIANAAPRFVACDDVDLIDPRSSAIWANQSGQHFHGRAFARAIRTDEQRNFAGLAAQKVMPRKTGLRP